MWSTFSKDLLKSKYAKKHHIRLLGVYSFKLVGKLQQRHTFSLKTKLLGIQIVLRGWVYVIKGETFEYLTNCEWNTNRTKVLKIPIVILPVKMYNVRHSPEIVELERQYDWCNCWIRKWGEIIGLNFQQKDRDSMISDSRRSFHFDHDHDNRHCCEYIKKPFANNKKVCEVLYLWKLFVLLLNVSKRDIRIHQLYTIRT